MKDRSLLPTDRDNREPFALQQPKREQKRFGQNAKNRQTELFVGVRTDLPGQASLFSEIQ